MSSSHPFRIAALALLTLSAAATAASAAVWTDVAATELAGIEDQRSIPTREARYVRVDPFELEQALALAPAEAIFPTGRDDARLALPLPRGGELLLRVIDSPIMEPELAARYPEIRTFRVVDAEDASIRGRIDWTPFGFHAMVRTPEGIVFVDPYRQGDRSLHQVYYRRDALPIPGREAHCLTDAPETGLAELIGDTPQGTGLDLRTYRTVVAATGEYTAFHGGTVPLGMAAIVVAMNRVNEVYENEVAIRMILVANNDSVVYTNPATDPYTNNSGGTMLGENQANLDAVIGNANYDFGHVFSTGGGGVAGLAVSCKTGQKARGVTGLPSPIGDTFYIDFVAHEMGHEWGGNHTFNSVNGNCGGGNRNGGRAFEPGSGSTIMAYAGICGSDNLQAHSDPYFHVISLQEIITYSRTGVGNTCAAFVPVGSDPPTVDAGADYTIPAATPFRLTGQASSPVGSITYCWEEFDLGPGGPPGANPGSAPLFRSWDPTSDPVRVFPRLDDLVPGTSNIGEFLPTVSRNMNFRLTARDNNTPGGNVAWDQMVLSIEDTAGPFEVTSPNTNLTWNGSGPHTVTWDVAGTDAAPVSCAAVEISLSTDGGFTYPTILAASVDNDGSAPVVLNVANTSTARIQVRCADNVFFDISDQNFTISNANTLIFADGFDSGDTSAWSSTTP